MNTEQVGILLVSTLNTTNNETVKTISNPNIGKHLSVRFFVLELSINYLTWFISYIICNNNFSTCTEAIMTNGIYNYILMYAVIITCFWVIILITA